MPMSQLLFSFAGRLNRQPYWLVTLALIVAVLIILGGSAAVMFGGGSGGASSLGILGIIALLLYIPLLWIGIAIGTKRLHDRNKSGWWLVLFWLVPGVLQVAGEQLGTVGIVLTLIGLGISIWGLVEIGFLRGTVGPNQYGPDPLEAAVLSTR